MLEELQQPCLGHGHFSQYDVGEICIMFMHLGCKSDVFCMLQNIENFMKDVYKSRYGEDIQDDSVKLLYSLAVSIFAIGGMLGGFCGGMIANRFGR
jgi:MFS family permease